MRTKRMLLRPSFESFPVIVGTGTDETKCGTRLLVRIRSIQGSFDHEKLLDPLSSITFMDSAQPLRETWLGLNLRRQSGDVLPVGVSNLGSMYEHVWRKACRLENP